LLRVTRDLPTKGGRPLRLAVEKRLAMKRRIGIVPRAQVLGSLAAALQGRAKA